MWISIVNWITSVWKGSMILKALPDDVSTFLQQRAHAWASCQIGKNPGCACAGNAVNVFPRHRLERKSLVCDLGMHHGTCVTHVPCCMSGSLTRDDGENVPGIPSACAIRNFMYLARGPWGELRICSKATGKICFDYNQFLVISDHDDDNDVLLLLMIMISMMKTPAPMTMATMMTMAKKMAILLLLLVLLVVGMMMMMRRMMIKK